MVQTYQYQSPSLLRGVELDLHCSASLTDAASLDAAREVPVWCWLVGNCSQDKEEHKEQEEEHKEQEEEHKEQEEEHKEQEEEHKEGFLEELFISEC